jgi:hypothetical protein
MPHPPPSPPTTTFVLRFWREWSPAPHWRGQIRHLESGASAAFLDLERAMGFIQQLGVMGEADLEKNGPGKENARPNAHDEPDPLKTED